MRLVGLGGGSTALGLLREKSKAPSVICFMSLPGDEPSFVSLPGEDEPSRRGAGDTFFEPLPDVRSDEGLARAGGIANVCARPKRGPHKERETRDVRGASLQARCVFLLPPP